MIERLTEWVADFLRRVFPPPPAPVRVRVEENPSEYSPRRR